MLSTRPLDGLLLVSTILTGTLSAQTMESYSPYWALNQPNSNNIWPYSNSTQMRYLQIHDWDTFSHQGVIPINGIRYRTSLDFNYQYVNRTGRTVEIEVKLGLAATGITAASRSRTFDSNWDLSTVKTVIAKKKFTFPNSGATPAALREFTIKFPFDTGSTFLYINAQKRSLVVQTKQYSTASGGYAFDFWQDTATNANDKMGGYSYRNGSYLGCNSKSNVLVEHDVEGSKLFVGTAGFAMSGNGQAATIPGVVSFGAQSLGATIPSTSCQLKNDLILLLPFVTDAKNEFSLNVPVANNPSLLYATFLSQAIYLEKGANAVGITTSRGLVNGIGTGTTSNGTISRVWYLGNPDSTAAATALSSAQNGLVTLFHN